ENVLCFTSSKMVVGSFFNPLKGLSKCKSAACINVMESVIISPSLLITLYRIMKNICEQTFAYGLFYEEILSISLYPMLFFCSFRSEEHTSELQSRFDLVCRLLLEKK